MVWLDRQGRMPTALPWFHFLVVTPVLAFLLLMPLVLIGARFVQRRRRGDDASQNEKSEV